MTLTEFEASLLTLPAWQRPGCAGAAAAVREQLGRGVAFAPALSATTADRRHHHDLTGAAQLATFAALTGP